MIVPLAQAGAGFGNKAGGLARVLGQVRVPAAVAVAGAWIVQFLPAETRSELARLLARADDGALPRILELTAGHSLPAEAIDQLRRAVAELPAPFVVRSSSRDEDAESLSFAGVFDSLLDVTPDRLADAVLAVWRSGFTPQALLAYRRAGLHPSPDHLNVLVQQAIQPELAGVAFTGRSGDGYLEWVDGHGHALVDGSRTPVREQLRPEASGWRAELAQQLSRLPDSDVEWAYDGEHIWIVQVRPRTAALPTTEQAGVRSAPLYEGDAQGLELGGIAHEYHRIRAKRRLPRAIALSHGARVPAGWLANWPVGQAGQAGLAEWSRTLPAEIVLDASSTERQHILPRHELAAVLTRLADPSEQTFAFLCREYLKGDIALLSTVGPDGQVYVEASPEGLLALNRGFGSARALDQAGLRALVGPDQAAALAATTQAHADQLHPRATLEWVVQDGTLFFVDYSAPAGSGPARHALDDARVLSGGLARGRVQHLGSDELLTESSIAPIISISEQVSPEQQLDLLTQLRGHLDLDPDGAGIIVAAARPIAVLSMLIGIVDGFLFEEGALLSHLGILLREAGVPATIVGTGNLPADGSLVELVHGSVIAAR